ncbi:enoyl-CoA hydratase/carnithine racemase [Thermocatellispora tengchongensis]|uniref:Enoyl-CoA hydratase/carnithine racemase n=1 Tax=Thermocatellispora tengchongensis TaxID=1073253 RepID=A0A840PC60_9ACTN|nr:enoyl-CoA hydratase/isomerase family protein [Thermocatellispora tengchongensis]MBB5136832.1 enoyl-CoA hydratase/carnithine racemase [Thermocatellispora tengchongensis]
MRSDVVGDVAHVVLDRPEARNAVSRAVHHALAAVLQDLRSREDVRFIVIKGAGRTFSSGGDLAELKEGLPENYVADYWRRMTGTVLAMRAADQIVIAAVQGAAVGAGAALALAADLVVAERDARFRFTFAHLGLMPDAGTSLVLPRLLGPAVARDLLLSGRWIGAAEAHERGMIARLAEPGGIDACVDGLLAELRQSPGATLALVKNLLESTSMAELPSVVRAEGVQQQAAAASGEYRRFLRRVYDGITSARARTTGNGSSPGPQ